MVRAVSAKKRKSEPTRQPVETTAPAAERTPTARDLAEPARPGLARLGWVVAWVLSLALAFLLGYQSRPNTPPASAPAGAPGAAGTPGAAQPAQPSQRPEVIQVLRSLPRRDANDVAARGRTDAKVVMIEWSDYRCPFCTMWAKTTAPQLEKYIADGTLRVEYRDLAIFGEQSVNTAIAARAAGKQGRYWEFHDAVVAAAPSSGHPEIGPNEIQAFARQAGVPDMAKFTADLADPQLKAQVQADTDQATKLGITGTPFFVINDTVINGARPTADFINAIEAAKKA